MPPRRASPRRRGRESYDYRGAGLVPGFGSSVGALASTPRGEWPSHRRFKRARVALNHGSDEGVWR
jgi:hypothetical protein